MKVTKEPKKQQTLLNSYTSCPHSGQSGLEEGGTSDSLKSNALFQVRKKDQINIETKNKTVRFIGELTKFKMFSKNDTLHCLKVSVIC